MRKERKHFTPEEKVAILRRHLVDKVPVSELCEELGLRPTMFYRWQKELFENGAAAFQSQANGLLPLADNAELTQRQGQAYSQRSESPRSREESLHLGMRAAVDQVL